MRLISLGLILFLFACSNSKKINESLVACNDKLIDYELLRLEELYMMFPTKVGSFYDEAEQIKNLYVKVRDNLLSDSIDDSAISDYLNFLHEYKYYPLEIESMKKELSSCDLSTKLIQIQNITIVSISNLHEQLFNYDYPTNACQIIAVRDSGNFIRLIISQIDTSVNPRFLIGKLRPNENKFLNNFDSVESKPGLARIPLSKLDNDKFIEGIVFLPRNNCDLDTIRFKSKIY